MRFLEIAMLAMLTSAALPVWAQPPSPSVPRSVNPVTGARPGNEIGTGQSLPLSEHAGNISPQSTKSRLAGRLPEPSVGQNGTMREYLIAARGALSANRTGEAQEALERAETRILDRSVPLGQTSAPIDDPMVQYIQRVLHTLGDGDLSGAAKLLDEAIAAAPR